MRVHVINLDRSPDRLNEFLRVNGHLTELRRVSAVDGRTLDLRALTRQGLVTENILDNFTIGGIGAAMSNLDLWNLAIATGHNVTICEDDAIFNRHFEAGAQNVLDMLPEDWDVVLWGWNFDLFLYFEMLPGVSNCLAQFEQEPMRANIRGFQEQFVEPRPFRLQWAFGYPCYTVSPKGARAIKQRLLPFRPMTIPFPEGLRAKPYMPYYRVLGVDGAMNANYRSLNAYVSFPPLVITRNEHGISTIQDEASAR